MRLDGTHPFTPNYRAHYTAEYARQDNYKDGDKRINADYYKIGGGFGIDNFNMRIDQELMSSNDNLYAFQTRSAPTIYSKDGLINFWSHHVKASRIRLLLPLIGMAISYSLQIIT